MDIRDAVSLQDLCLLTVSNYLSPSNVWSVYRLVPFVHSTRIEYVVYSFICDHFMEISHTDQFLALDEKEIQWLLDNQDLKVSEAAMLDSLARWYKHNESQRENAFKQLFNKVHVRAIRKEVLSQLIIKYRLAKFIPEFSIKCNKMFPKRLDLDDLIYQKNISRLVLISLPAKSVKNRTFRYIPCRSEVINYSMPFWSKYIDVELTQVGLDKFATYVVPYQEKLYILDSKIENSCDSIAEKYFACIDLKTRTIHQCSLPPKEVPSNGLFVVCGIYLFIIGGEKDISVQSLQVLEQTVFRYDIVNDKWRKMTSTVFGHSRNNAYAVELAFSYKNRFLYIMGRHCEKYDLFTNTWTPILVHDCFQSGVFCSSVHVFDSNIYLLVIPRDQPTVRCFVYIAEDCTWVEPFKKVPYCQITKVFFGKPINISKEVQQQGQNNQAPQIHYKIAQLRVSGKEPQNRKLKVSNERTVVSTVGSGFTAFDAAIVSRGMSFNLKQN